MRCIVCELMNNLQTVQRRGSARSVLDVDDLTAAELASLLDAAADAAGGGGQWSEALKGRHIALVFDKPSTRTRVSFEVAVSAMGGIPLVLKGDELQLGRGETFEDTARALSCYVDAIVIRIGEHRVLQRFAAGAGVPVINALTSAAHPCQTFADLKTIRDVFGSLAGVRVTYVGDPNNVARSLMLGAALSGMQMTLACPPAYVPPDSDLTAVRALSEPGATLEVTTDAAAACTDAQVIYTDTWTSMGFEDQEHERRNAFSDYRVTSDLVRRAQDNAIVMHCLPAHRGDEITAEVLDGPQSVVWTQAENRLYAQMALLRWLLSPG